MLKEELKKIWRPGPLLALLILGVVFYTIFLEFYIRRFPENYGGAHGQGLLAVSSGLVNSYGTRLSEQELKEASAQLEQLYAEAGNYIQNFPIGKKYNLKTYADYENFQQATFDKLSGKTAVDQNEQYADLMRMNNYMQSDGTNNIDGRIYALSLYTDIYHTRQTYGSQTGNTPYDDDVYTTEESVHARQAFFGRDKMWQNILPWEVPETISSFSAYLLILICLSICLLLSPLPVHDHISRMEPVQYSSRRGRNIFKIQFTAVMLSAFLLTTIYLLFFGGLFAAHGTGIFFPCRMYSFMFTPFCWPNWTHGTWCLTLGAMSYLVAFGIAGAVFYLSHGSGNYIIMLLKLVPLFAAAAFICPKILENAFYYTNALYQYTKLPYIEGLCAAGIFAAGILLCQAAWRKVRKGMQPGKAI